MSDWPHGHAPTTHFAAEPHAKGQVANDPRAHNAAQYHRRKPVEKRVAQMSAASRRRNRGR